MQKTEADQDQGPTAPFIVPQRAPGRKQYPQGGGACRGQAIPHDRAERDRRIRMAPSSPTAAQKGAPYGKESKR